MNVLPFVQFPTAYTRSLRSKLLATGLVLVIALGLAAAPSASTQAQSLNRDYGDAPPPYPTLRVDGGPAHGVGGAVYLGLSVDAEADGQPHPLALGDDLNGDDENGVEFIQDLVVCSSAMVRVIASAPGKLNAWVDFNGNGDWSDLGDAIFTDRQLVAGANVLQALVPCTAAPGLTFARFRFDSEGGLSYEASKNGYTPVNGEVEDYQVEIVPQGADVGIEVADDPDPVPAGSSLVYTLLVQNLGPLTATSAVVTDVLPIGVDFVAGSSSQGTCLTQQSLVTCSVGTLLPQAQATVRITVSVHSGIAGQLYDSAGVTADEFDPVPDNNIDSESTTVIAQGGLDFGDAPAPYSTLLVDNGARHTRGALNLGRIVDTESDGNPHALSIGDDYDSDDDEDGITFVPVDLAPGTLASVEVDVVGSGFLSGWIDFHSDGSWAGVSDQIIPDVPVGGGKHTFGFAVPHDAVLTNRTYARFRLSDAPGVSYDGIGGLEAAPLGEVEDHAVAISQVGGAPLALVKTSDPTAALWGWEVDYTLEVTNNSTGGMTNVEIVDIMPVELSFQSLVPPAPSGAGVCSDVPAKNSIGETLRCSWPSIAAMSSERVVFRVVVLADPPVGTVEAIRNEATASALEHPTPVTAVHLLPVYSKCRADIVIAVDNSASMGASPPGGGMWLDLAKSGSKHFLDRLNLKLGAGGSLLPTQVGVLSFDHTASPELAFPSGDVAAAKNAVDLIGLSIHGGTAVGAGIGLAEMWLLGPGRDPNSIPIVVVVSDGDDLPANHAVSQAVATSAKGNGIVVSVVDFSQPFPDHMGTLASRGHYHPTISVPQDIDAAFDAMAFSICRSGGEEEAELVVTKVDSNDPIAIGFIPTLLLYTVDVTNIGPAAAYDVVMVDTLPSMVSIPGTFPPMPTGAPPFPFSCQHDGSPTGGKVTCWLGDMAPGETRQMTVTVGVPPGSPCEIVNWASAEGRNTNKGQDDERTKILNGGACPDTGDAPDSTNHSSSQMTAYAGVVANFPTVFDDVVGPPGPAHLKPSNWFFLGMAVSEEADADVDPDEDGFNNLNPLFDVADQDGDDDGVNTANVAIPSCGATAFPFDVTALNGPVTVFVNVWLDFNRDGDWADTLTCEDAGGNQRVVREWSVRDYQVSLSTGVQSLMTPAFYGAGLVASEGPLWMRLTVADVVSPLAGDGRGPAVGYTFGETEDYFIDGG